MLKLDTIPANELASKIVNAADDALPEIIDEVKTGNARVLTSETAVGVIKILQDISSKTKILFLSILEGSNGREYLRDLENFAKSNGIFRIDVQTRKQSALKVLTNRFNYQICGMVNGYIQLRKAI